MKNLAILIVVLVALPLEAQTSSVTATITDSDAQTWNNGTYTINFIPTPGVPGPYTWNGGQSFTRQFLGSFDGSGVLTIALPSNNFISPAGSNWQFTLCPNASAPCSNVVTSAIGPTPNLSGILSAGITAPRFQTGATSYGYLDIEAGTPAAPLVPGTIYWNVTNGLTRQWTGTVWQNLTGGVGLTCAPITANRVVYINNSSACVTSNTLGFVSTNNTLTVGASGGAAVGTLKANGTSGSFGATLSTNSTGTQILLGANAAGFPLTIDGDSATTPVNYIRLRAESAIGVSQGLEFSGQGDVSSSGGAAGFKVTNATSVNGTSPGASNSLTAGNAQGTTSSPGGSNSLIAGNSSGTGASSPGGSNIITAGTASGGNNLGGDITLTSGNGAGTGRGGNINLNTGTGTPNGKLLVNGAPLLGVVASATAAIGGTQTVVAAASTWLTQNVTMPTGGCPCRAFVSYGAIIGNGNSGVITLWVEDGTSQFATTQWLTNAASATGPGGSGGAFSPTTYANNAVITFNARGFSNTSGGTAIITTPLGGSTQASWMSIAIFTSN